jgi:hypothetical protein
VKEHLLAWNIEGRILESPMITTWWIPYDYNAIMRYGHSVNSDIPEDPNEAEFPPTPWPERVVIRIKSQAPPQIPTALLSVDGSPAPSAPDSPSGWKGSALGQSPPISADAAALVGYHSQYESRPADQGEEEDQPDPEVLKIRGEAMKNEEVHGVIGWTTRKNYPLRIGVSLPIVGRR